MLAGNASANVFVGGGGTDLVDFTNATGGVTANLTTGTVKGAGSDTLAGVEQLRGSARGDTFVGDAGGNRLDGRGGNDELRGGDGNDDLIGGRKSDFCGGGPGTDTAASCETVQGVP